MRGGDATAPTPAKAGVQVPATAGVGQPPVAGTQVATNSSISSTGAVKTGGVTGTFTNLGAEVVNLGGFDTLQFKMAPASSVVTNQETLAYMDGGLTTGATLGSDGIFGAFFRGITGASVLQNAVSNPTSNTLKMVLSPLLQGSIIQVDIKPGETWRFADKSFMACTPNLAVSGNVNIFSNFRMMFIGENLTYTTVSANQGTAGSVWVTAHGGIEKHELTMGTGSTVPLFINNGCFLGMMDNNGSVNFWNDYVSVGSANGLLSAMFTQLGWVMKIQDTTPPVRPGPIKCVVLTQSLNPQNLEKYIASIARKIVEQHQSNPRVNPMMSGVGPTASASVLGTAAGAGALAAAGSASAASAPSTVYEKALANAEKPAAASNASTSTAVPNASVSTAVPNETASASTAVPNEAASASTAVPNEDPSVPNAPAQEKEEESRPPVAGGGSRRRKSVKVRKTRRRL